ncbi:MAG: hydantoinase B/oxoprolinase family protein [Planctomycetota bacterium]
MSLASSRRARKPRGSRPAVDPIRLEVFHQLLAALCEEAGAVLMRSAASANIRERRDFSIALFDGDGRLLAQAAHIPVHLGSAAQSVAAVRAELTLEPGDLVILNDPYRGGTHLPDVTLVMPVFLPGHAQPRFFLVNRAHHADIGGAVPGSMAAATDLLAEGLVIPPVKLRRAGAPAVDILALILANVRGAEERRIDFAAQEASLQVAQRRLLALVADQGDAVVREASEQLLEYSHALATAVIAELPRRRVSARDVLDDDGAGTTALPIHLELGVTAGRLRFDWSESADQARGGVNCNRGIAVAASVYLLRCLCPERLPTNEGLFRAIEVVTRRGSLLEPIPPAPVAGGNVETSQRLVDVGLAALRKLLGARIPANSSGTMVNLTLGIADASGVLQTTYETLPGGAGAGPGGAAASAIQTHMTNTRNTPIEDAEQRLPIVVESLTVRRGSGGRGKRRGGDGVRKCVRVLVPASISVFAERAESAPAGARGGGPGKRFSVRATMPDGRRVRLPSKCARSLPAGARITLETPGGGGHGR